MCTFPYIHVVAFLTSGCWKGGKFKLLVEFCGNANDSLNSETLFLDRLNDYERFEEYFAMMLD